MRGILLEADRGGSSRKKPSLSCSAVTRCQPCLINRSAPDRGMEEGACFESQTSFNKMHLFFILLLFVLSVPWYCHYMEWDFWPIKWYACHFCTQRKGTNEVNVTTASVQLRLNVMRLGGFGICARKEQNLAKHFRVLVQICSYSTAFFKSDSWKINSKVRTHFLQRRLQFSYSNKISIKSWLHADIYILAWVMNLKRSLPR